jgi:type I restriction enzyme M protein
VAVGNNFFYTRSLPCHLWFLDKGKREQNKDKILMIDARNTFRKVNTKINDFSAGQLRNFQAIMQAYRGDKSAIKTALNANQEDSIEQAKAMSAEVNTLRKALQKALQDHDHNLLDFESVNTELKDSLELDDSVNYSDSDCEALLSSFEKPANKCSTLLENYQTQLVIDKKSMLAAEKKDKKINTALRKQLETKNKILRELEGLFKDYEQKVTQSGVGEALYDYKQSLDDWKILNKHFPKQQYKDIEGLCKVVDLAEIKENDYSLTPGRYVGYSIQIDMDFDYQGRMDEIHKELAELNNGANELMDFIQGVK